MLVWKGKGLLVILSGIIGGMAAGAISSLIANIGVSESLEYAVMWIAWGLAAAGVNYLLCRWFVSTEKRIYVDEQTGQRVEVSDNSSLFFIRNRIWTYIFAILFCGLGLLQTI